MLNSDYSLPHNFNSMKLANVEVENGNCIKEIPIKVRKGIFETKHHEKVDFIKERSC